MSVTLYIERGAETVMLSSGNWMLFEPHWEPRGGRGPDVVTEEIGLYCQQSDPAGVRDAVRALEKMIAHYAPERQSTKTGNKTWLVFAAYSGATAMRSEITGGTLGGVSLHRLNLPENQAVTLHITRRNFWEADTETQLDLDNINGTDNTAGLEVDNTDDTTRDNFVEVDAADVGGVLPGAARLEITNNFVGDDMRTVYVGVAPKDSADPDNFTHILEAESATRDGTYASSSATADAAASNGEYVSVAALPSTSVDLFTWTVSSAQLGYAGYLWFHALLRFFTKPSNGTITARLTVKNGATTLWQSQYFVLGSSDTLQSLGPVQISPALFDVTSLAPLTVILSASDSAATGTFALDYLALLPTDSWRKLSPFSSDDVDNAETLVIDDIDDVVYVTQAGGKSPFYSAEGRPLRLWPGVDHRIYILHDDSLGNAAITRTCTVKLYYRQRVVTL